MGLLLLAGVRSTCPATSQQLVGTVYFKDVVKNKMEVVRGSIEKGGGR